MTRDRARAILQDSREDRDTFRHASSSECAEICHVWAQLPPEASTRDALKLIARGALQRLGLTERQLEEPTE